MEIELKSSAVGAVGEAGPALSRGNVIRSFTSIADLRHSRQRMDLKLLLAKKHRTSINRGSYY